MIILNSWQKYLNTATIHIDLQEGFENDTVKIFIDGQEVYSQQEVKTRYQISFADSIECETTHPSANVEIHLPGKNIKSGIKVQVPQHPYLGINISTDGKIYFKSSSHPFGYL